MTTTGIYRRDALVTAALDCLAEKGFKGLRLRDVATRAGIDHSTLHHHFATKRDLVDRVGEHVVRQFWPTMPQTGPPAERLHEHLAALARMIQEQPTLFAVLSEFDQRAHHDPQVRAMLAEHEHGWRTVLGQLFRAGTWRTRVDPDAAVELVIAAVKGVSRNPDAAAPVLTQLEALLARRP
ncbi:MAG: TetR family transcriptional regulator [Streptosporangiales bacterium]|nr:TetR family transcriptional regulator [Streptosporangiales bacterium]